eukprot:768382-Hanusia_phi.AAC.2
MASAMGLRQCWRLLEKLSRGGSSSDHDSAISRMASGERHVQEPGEDGGAAPGEGGGLAGAGEGEKKEGEGEGEARGVLVLVCVFLASATATQWQCSVSLRASAGVFVTCLGKISPDVFCIQYYQGKETSYCCDHTGYFCSLTDFTIYNPNHVFQGSFMVVPTSLPSLPLFLTQSQAGNLTSNVGKSASASGEELSGRRRQRVRQADASEERDLLHGQVKGRDALTLLLAHPPQVFGSNDPSGVNECGAGSTDPNDPAYCIVMLEAVCLDNGQ